MNSKIGFLILITIFQIAVNSASEDFQFKLNPLIRKIKSLERQIEILEYFSFIYSEKLEKKSELIVRLICENVRNKKEIQLLKNDTQVVSKRVKNEYEKLHIDLCQVDEQIQEIEAAKENISNEEELEIFLNHTGTQTKIIYKKLEKIAEEIKRGRHENHLKNQVQDYHSILYQISKPENIQKIQLRLKLEAEERERINREIQEKRKEIIEECILAIKLNDTSTARDKWEKLKEINGNIWLEEDAEIIINSVYNKNINNFERVDNFLRNGFLLEEEKIKGYQVLFQEMKSAGHLKGREILRLGYILKDIIDKESLILPKYKIMAENIKSSLPIAVQILLWKSFCLRNKYFGEYLYAANDAHNVDNDNNTRRVFTWISYSYKEKEAVWKLEPVQDGNAYLIKNPFWNGWLYFSESKDFRNKRRFIYLKIDQIFPGRSTWNFEIVNEAEVRIWTEMGNNLNNEVYYAEGDSFLFDGERRQVFTWADGDFGQYNKDIWIVEEC